MGCGPSNEEPIVIEEPASSSPIQTLPSDLPKPTRSQPQVGNAENFVIVWLDASIDINTDTKKTKEQLQQIANIIKMFTDPEEYRTFIGSIKDEKIFLIISGTLREQFVPTVQEATQIDSTYVFCSNKEKHEVTKTNQQQALCICTTSCLGKLFSL
jgi:hypothetical protein